MRDRNQRLRGKGRIESPESLGSISSFPIFHTAQDLGTRLITRLSAANLQKALDLQVAFGVSSGDLLCDTDLLFSCSIFCTPQQTNSFLEETSRTARATNDTFSCYGVTCPASQALAQPAHLLGVWLSSVFITLYTPLRQLDGFRSRPDDAPV